MPLGGMPRLGPNTYERCEMIRDMSKLTLSVNDRVVKRAKRYAAKRGTSVSHLVEQYLDLVSNGTKSDHTTAPPVLRMLRGVARGAGVGHYKRHLLRKYR